ncbi:FtsX-like permease family protein [Candidatus Palauibacter sp.]|uniref:FtsX-like permease family protein n=1 Tax=Candidatus Palauibacter sp. TaxID=3101350 RepID=UPI003D0C5A10
MSRGRGRFERFVARRYLRGTGRRTSVFGVFRAFGRFLRRPWQPLAGAGSVDEKDSRLVTFISSLAVGGVAVGVMALIVVIGVLNGLQESLRDRILSGGPHAHVMELDNGFQMDDWETVLDRVRQDEDVIAASPFAFNKVILTQEGDRYNESVVLRGIPNDPEGMRIAGLMEHLIIGEPPFGPTESGNPGIVVGRGLAQKMGLYQGKVIVAASTRDATLSAAGLSAALRRFEVTGIFQTGLYQYDDELAMAPLAETQTLFGLGEAVTGIEFDVSDPWDATEVSARLEEALGWPYRVEGWQELNRSLFSALRLEKLGMAVVLILIVLVASFNIVSTLVMMVADRTREIGILRSMGVTSRGVGKVFTNMGLFIGVVGTTLGATLGALLAWALTRYEFITLPSDVYFIDRLPISLAPLDVTLIVLGSLLISYLATIYPARKAAALAPVDAIRHE